jgi:hypothetical protein
MAKFNLDEYETVKERKKRFRESHPDGRISVKLLNLDSAMEYALFEARVYKDVEDQKVDLPLGVGNALEVRDKELSISNQGREYESVNYASWTENAEESAVGRALDNAGYANEKPSRNEMEKAGKMGSTMRKVNADKATEKQVKAIWAISKDKGIPEDKLKSSFRVESLNEVTFNQASQFIERFGKKKEPEMNEDVSFEELDSMEEAE